MKVICISVINSTGFNGIYSLDQPTLTLINPTVIFPGVFSSTNGMWSAKLFVQIFIFINS